MAMNGPDNVSNTQMLEYEEKWLVFFLFCFFVIFTIGINSRIAYFLNFFGNFVNICSK